MKYDPNSPQYCDEMRYPGSMHVNMTKHGSSKMQGNANRAHHSTVAAEKRSIISAQTQMHAKLERGVVTRTAVGIIGDGSHSEKFKFPIGTDVKKSVPNQHKKMGKSGIVRGSI